MITKIVIIFWWTNKHCSTAETWKSGVGHDNIWIKPWLASWPLWLSLTAFFLLIMTCHAYLVYLIAAHSQSFLIREKVQLISVRHNFQFEKLLFTSASMREQCRKARAQKTAADYVIGRRVTLAWAFVDMLDIFSVVLFASQMGECPTADMPVSKQITFLIFIKNVSWTYFSLSTALKNCANEQKCENNSNQRVENCRTRESYERSRTSFGRPLRWSFMF